MGHFVFPHSSVRRFCERKRRHLCDTQTNSSYFTLTLQRCPTEVINTLINGTCSSRMLFRAVSSSADRSTESIWLASSWMLWLAQHHKKTQIQSRLHRQQTEFAIINMQSNCFVFSLSHNLRLMTLSCRIRSFGPAAHSPLRCQWARWWRCPRLLMRWESRWLRCCRPSLCGGELSRRGS